MHRTVQEDDDDKLLALARDILRETNAHPSEVHAAQYLIDLISRERKFRGRKD